MAVELILRPWRTAHADDEQLNLTARRSAMQRAYAMPDIARQPDEPILEGFPNSVYTLEDLRDQALNEARDGRGRRRDLSLGSAQVELATKAGYYLILADPMGLRREAPPSSRRDGVPVDQRSPSAVLTAMLSTRRGVQQAYAIVINGRKGETLWEVNEDGTYRRSTAGEFIALTDEKIRATYGGRSTRKKELLGLAAVEEAWQDLAETIDTLDRATQTLAAVRSASGRRYLDEEGWPEGEVKPIRDRIERVLHKLRSWEYRWLERQDDLEG